MTTTAERINTQLKKKDWDEATLAKISGLHQPTVHRIISGESKNPKLPSLKAIAKALNVSVAYLTGEDNDNHISEYKAAYPALPKSAAKLIKRIEELAATGMQEEDFTLTLKLLERISKD